MPALFIFLFKVNAALLLFCAGYFLVLRRLTFYTLNRVYLMVAIAFSTVYPLLNLDGFLLNHQQLADNVQVIINWKKPANAFVEPFLQKPDYWFYASILFWCGVTALSVRFVIQMVSLFRLHRRSVEKQVHGHRVRVINGDAGPFSFWQNIYLNPENHSDGDLRAILHHEQIHVDELHMLDILIAELSTIFYWFNPGVWLMKKAVRENIEFITDRKILLQGTDSKAYQYSLLSVGMVTTSNRLVNNFNLSIIKKRIIMMNAKRSSRLNLARYMFLLPAVVLVLLVFSFSNKAIAKKAINRIHEALISTANVNNSGTDVHQTAIIKSTTHNILKHASQKGESKSFIVVTGIKHDTLNYILNGRRVTKADIDILHHEKIKSVDVLSSENTKKVIPEFANGHSSVIITTNDSKAGLEFEEKIRKNLTIGSPVKNAIAVDTAKQKDIVFTEVEHLPAFPGGLDEMYKFIGQNLKYPSLMKENKIEGKVFVSFIVEYDGSLSNMKILKSPGYGSGEEAVRVLALSPKWIPAEQNGHKVRCQYTIPITFTLKS